MADNDETCFLPDTAALAARNPGRLPNGRCKPGYSPATGNPEAKAQYEARQLWRNATTDEERLKVRQALIEQAHRWQPRSDPALLRYRSWQANDPYRAERTGRGILRAEQTNVVAVILGALAAFPEAKLAVAAKLAGRAVQVEGSSYGSDDGSDAAV